MMIDQKDGYGGYQIFQRIQYLNAEWTRGLIHFGHAFQMWVKVELGRKTLIQTFPKVVITPVSQHTLFCDKFEGLIFIFIAYAPILS